MNFEDFYMTQCLKDIKCFKNLVQKDYEYILVFNNTVTKLFMIKQNKTDYKITTFNNLIDRIVSNQFKDSSIKKAVNKKDRAIQMYAMCKENNIIMNWIPEKKISFLRDNK